MKTSIVLAVIAIVVGVSVVSAETIFIDEPKSEYLGQTCFRTVVEHNDHYLVHGFDSEGNQLPPYEISIDIEVVEAYPC